MILNYPINNTYFIKKTKRDVLGVGGPKSRKCGDEGRTVIPGMEEEISGGPTWGQALGKL